MVAAALLEPRWTDLQVLIEYVGGDAERQKAPRLLPQCLAAAERFLANHCRHQWLPEPVLETDPPVAKQFSVRPGRLRVGIPDLWQCTAATYGGAAVPYELDGTYDSAGLYWPAQTIRFGAGLGLLPWQVPLAYGPVPVVVTGYWGWRPIPEDIVDAAYRLAARIYHEKKATYSDTVLLPEGGVLQYFRQLPASVQGAVAYYAGTHIGLARVPGSF